MRFQLNPLLPLCLITAGFAGCATAPRHPPELLDEITASDLPRELDMVTQPVYRVGPSDVILLEAVQLVRSANTALKPGEEIHLAATYAAAEVGASDSQELFDDDYLIQPDGTVDLGPDFGSVPVEGLSLDQIRQAVHAHLKDAIGLEDPKVSASLSDVTARQELRGEFPVQTDGAISLGIYGSVYVAGMMVEEIRLAVETQLSAFVQQPEVRVELLETHGQRYYVVINGGGADETVIPLVFLGNETVLDAVAQIDGWSRLSAKPMWISRPSPNGLNVAQRLPIDWRAITQDGVTTTNYQILPGDRVYVQAEHPIKSRGPWAKSKRKTVALAESPQ